MEFDNTYRIYKRPRMASCSLVIVVDGVVRRVSAYQMVTGSTTLLVELSKLVTTTHKMTFMRLRISNTISYVTSRMKSLLA